MITYRYVMPDGSDSDGTVANVPLIFPINVPMPVDLRTNLKVQERIAVALAQNFHDRAAEADELFLYPWPAVIELLDDGVAFARVLVDVVGVPTARFRERLP